MTNKHKHLAFIAALALLVGVHAFEVRAASFLTPSQPGGLLSPTLFQVVGSNLYPSDPSLTFGTSTLTGSFGGITVTSCTGCSVGSSPVIFRANGTAFVTTSTIGFTAGTNVTLTTSTDGTYTIAATGGGGGAGAFNATGTPGGLAIFTATSTATSSAALTFATSTNILTVLGTVSSTLVQAVNTTTTNLRVGTLSGILKGTSGLVGIASAGADFESPITAGTTADYWRGDKSFQTLNQAAVAGLTTSDSPVFAGLTISGVASSSELRSPSSTLTRLTVGSDTVTDLTGTGLGLVSNALTVSLGGGSAQTCGAGQFVNSLSATGTTACGTPAGGGGGGSGTVTTSTAVTAGYLPAWTADGLLAGTSTVFQAGALTGIRTTQPSSTLHVVGTFTSTASSTLGGAAAAGTQVNIATAGTDTVPSLIFSGDADTGLYALADNYVGITISGGANLRVGQGVAAFGVNPTPGLSGDNILTLGANSLRWSKVYVASQIGSDTSGTPTLLTVKSTDGSGTDIAGGPITISGGRGTGAAAGGTISFQTAASSTTGSTLNATSTRMIITDRGLVGIGTAAPSSTLHVIGKLRVSTTTTPATNFFDIYHDGTNAVLDTGAGAIDIQDRILLAGGSANPAAITLSGLYGIYASGSGLAIANSGTGVAAFNSDGEQMGSNKGYYWTDNTDPAGGSRDLFLTRAGTAMLRLGQPDAASPVNQTLTAQGGSGVDKAGANLTIQAGVPTGTGGNGNLFFVTASPGTTGSTANVTSTRMTITPSGFIGIATTQPSSTLQVGNPADSTFSYLQIDATSTQPAAADCDAASEAGRQLVVPSSTIATSRLYTCTGAGGWGYTNLTP